MLIPKDIYLQRWLVLLKKLPASKAQKYAIYNDLKLHYAESHRAYHTFEHIKACLRQLDKVTQSLENAFNIELALWFHDVIYDPRSRSNELDSAVYAKQALQKLGLPQNIIQQIYYLILLTQHPSQPQTLDEQILLDIDLSILGAEKADFERYNKNIRIEYNWVDEAMYRHERVKVLVGFLEQKHIYHSNQFFSEREQLARKNIESIIANSD